MKSTLPWKLYIYTVNSASNKAWGKVESGRQSIHFRLKITVIQSALTACKFTHPAYRTT